MKTGAVVVSTVIVFLVYSAIPIEGLGWDMWSGLEPLPRLQLPTDDKADAEAPHRGHFRLLPGELANVVKLDLANPLGIRVRVLP